MWLIWPQSWHPPRRNLQLCQRSGRSPAASAPLQFWRSCTVAAGTEMNMLSPKISFLTMPIYFDNQLTLVPVQPPMGQWFIRIDQFWVASCAAVWGQTQAWLAVQSGVLSNARPWLTAHQHAELNSLAKCFPFAPISHSYTTMNARLRWNKTLTRLHILLLHFCTFERKVNNFPDILDDTGSRGRRL